MTIRVHDTIAFYEELLARLTERRRELAEWFEVEDRTLRASEDYLRGEIDGLRGDKKPRVKAAPEKSRPEPLPTLEPVRSANGAASYTERLLSTTIWVDRVAITLADFGQLTEKEIYDRIKAHAADVNKTTVSSSLQKLKAAGWAHVTPDHRWFLKYEGPWPGWRQAREASTKRSAHSAP